MAKLSAVGVAAIGFGGLLLYSAVEGKNFSGAFRNILSGKSPTTAAASNPITTTLPAGASGSPISNVGTTVVAPSNASESAWITSFLMSIGAPATSANINSISSWISHESVFPGGPGKGGMWNPLNTTLGQSGATNYNSVGVKNYVSEAQGLAATAQTILGGGYSDIVSALRTGNGLCGQSFSGLSRWSGGGYSRVC